MTTRTETTLGIQRLPFATLLLMATVGFGLAVRPGTGGLALAALFATVTVALAANSDSTIDGRHRLEVGLLVSILVFALLGWVRPLGGLIGDSTSALDFLPGGFFAAIALFVFVGRRNWKSRWSLIVACAVVVVTLISGSVHILMAENIGFDVLFLHREAANALAEGNNPYTDAVTVNDGAPTAQPGDVIIGYPYPPVTLIAYSLSEWTLGDPRYTSLAAIAGVLIVLFAHAIRTGSRLALYIPIMLVALPGFPLVLRAGWTEPLSLLLLSLAFMLWEKPATSGTFLGLGLASKQYFVVTAPVLLLHRDRSWTKRATVAMVVAGVTLAVPLLFDAAAYIQATVGFHASTPPRPDSANLVGLLADMGISWTPPFWLGLVAGLGAAVLLGKKSTTVVQFILASTVALGISFFLASQAFANYWFMLAGATAVALSLTVARGVASDETATASPPTP